MSRPQPRAPRGRQHPRRRQRGSAVVETALSLIVLMVLVAVMGTLGHAMVLRHSIGSASTRAARVCALADPAVTQGCVDAQINGFFQGRIPPECARFDVSTQEQDLNGVQVLGVEIDCDYVGFAARFLATQTQDTPLQLTARAVMPRR